MIDYNDRIFRSVSTTVNDEITGDTIFYYRQQDFQVTATYSGGNITDGVLTANADESGNLCMRCQHSNNNGQFLTGICFSTPELLPNGKIRLHEKWQYTCGDFSQGQSVLEEV